MIQNYFDQQLELAVGIVALADAESTLGKRERIAAKEQRDSLEAKFMEVRNKYVDAILGTSEGRERAYDLVVSRIAALHANCHPSWNPAINYVSEKLLPHLQKEASRDPRVRKAIKAIPLILVATAMIAYFAIRFLFATPINHSLETRKGILERAAAVEKVLRYDDWMDSRVRRGGWVKGILLWPIEPNEAEIMGASEFAALAFEAHQINIEDFGCPAIHAGYGDMLSQKQINYLSEMASYLRGPNVQWKEPPVITIVDAAKVIGKC